MKHSSPIRSPFTAHLASRWLAADVKTIEKFVSNNSVVVFMKGNPEAPRCGFSNAVVQVLRMHGVTYESHDVLQNEDVRQGIKDFTNWPTIPQVFIKGEFVGGCDILLQMHQNGELVEELKKAGIRSALLDAHPDGSEDKSTEQKWEASWENQIGRESYEYTSEYRYVNVESDKSMNNKKISLE